MHGHPQIVGARIEAHADGVAQAGGDRFVAGAVGIVAMHGGAHRILAEIDVRLRSDREIQLRAVAIERERARVVAGAHAGERDDLLAGARHRHRLRVVGVDLDRRRLGDIQLIAFEREAVRAIELLDDRRAHAVLDHEHVAVAGRVADQDLVARAEHHEARPHPREVHELFDDESGRRRQRRALGLRRRSSALLRTDGVANGAGRSFKLTGFAARAGPTRRWLRSRRMGDALV